MKTEYKALWVDDKHSTVIGEKKLIDNFLKTEGIKFTSIDVTFKPSWTAEKDDVFISAINDPELDIAFIDFNMALTSDLHPDNYGMSIALLLTGCMIQSIGVVLELKPKVAMMSAEAFV